MRSRDGNLTLLLSIYSLIFCTSVFSAEEYFISYRYAVQNAILLNESLDVSKTMTPCKGEPLGNSLLLSSAENSKNLKQTLLLNSDQFFSYINTLGLHVKSFEQVSNGIESSLTTITLRPTCFTVEINENFVKITPFKE